MRFVTILFIAFALNINCKAQSVTISQLDELFDGYWYSTLDTQQILRDVDPAIINPIAGQGCLFLGQSFAVGAPPIVQSAIISGCYDLSTGKVVGGIPYNISKFAAVNNQPQPKSAIGNGWYTHFKSSFSGGNPSPTGGDTIVAFDSLFNYIGSATVDGDPFWAAIFPFATQAAVIDPHDFEGFTMNGEKYLTFTVARRQFASNNNNYIMQGLAVYKLDALAQTFVPVAFSDMDGLVDFDLVNPLAPLDIMHPNELDVIVSQELGQLDETATIGVSNRNSSTVWLFGFSDAQTTSLNPKAVIGQPFPVLSGQSLPLYTMLQNNFPLNQQHGALLLKDSLNQTYVYSHNNGSTGVNFLENRQSTSYVAYKLSGDTARQLLSFPVKIGSDSIFSACCGGVGKIEVEGVPPIGVFWSGLDLIKSPFMPGTFEFIEGTPNGGNYYNFVWMVPPPFGNWHKVLSFHLPINGANNSRNLGNFMPYDKLPAERENTIGVGYQNGNTLLWCPNVNVWSINKQVEVIDTLILPGTQTIEELKTYVSAWAKDSLYLWKVQNWTDTPIMVSVDEAISQNQFSIYPNPSSGSVIISGQPGFYQVFDVSGQLVKEIQVSQPRQKIELGVSAGVYFISSQAITRKIVVQQ